MNLLKVERVLGVTEDDEEEGGAAGPASPTSPAGSTPAKKARLAAANLDDFDCILCMKLMYEPVTTPCGHSFCKLCFARAMDHGNRWVGVRAGAGEGGRRGRGRADHHATCLEDTGFPGRRGAVRLQLAQEQTERSSAARMSFITLAL